MKLAEYLDKQSKVVLSLVCFLLIALFTWVDYWTGSELAFSIFYLLPIYLAAWFVGRKLGIVVATASALGWFAADFSTVHYSHPLLPVWNAAVRLWFFIIIVYILMSLHAALKREEEMARQDFLTGAANSRAFYEQVAAEIERARRYSRPLTLVYMDVDNFKTVNDEFGHDAGDELLRAIAETLRRKTRTSDTVARLGGDEFAVLLPETDYEAARAVLEKARERLLAEAANRNLPISFSFGAVTCVVAPSNANEIIKAADRLMYEGKQSGKNALNHVLLTSKSARIA
jgi:diguanylate cyclase (GGDEF)-like protein